MSLPPPPTPPDETWMNRVVGLLAKAESTEYPEEAEALVAKAQQLMARHAIDDAMLAAAGRVPTELPTLEEVLVVAPYATAKAALLSTVAHANHCRAVRQATGDGSQRCTVVGHPSDLAAVRTLFGALSVHAARAMVAEVVPPGDTPRRFRHAFLLAFTYRIGERLRAAAAAAQRAAESAGVPDGPGVGLVLASRREAVEAAFHQAFPRVRTARATASSWAGATRGRAAADQAGLGQQEVATSHRRGIGR